MRFDTHLSAQGGWLAPEDLARYRAREAVVTEIGYRGFRIATGSDTEVLEALLILERFDLRALGHNSAAALHIIAEACRLAHADFYRYMTAPEGGPPAAAALEKAHIDALAARIRADGVIEARLFPDEADGPAPPGAASTTTSYLAADAAGNLAAALQTHGHVFGSGVTVPGTGMLLNDQMMGYNPEPGTRASVGPGRERATSGLAGSRDNPRRRVFRLRRAGGKPGALRIDASGGQRGGLRSRRGDRARGAAHRLRLDPGRATPRHLRRAHAIGDAARARRSGSCRGGGLGPSRHTRRRSSELRGPGRRARAGRCAAERRRQRPGRSRWRCGIVAASDRAPGARPK